MQKIKLISDTFEVINHVTQGNFVTIRNFDLIPDESSIENDIDVLIPNEYINSVVDAVKPFKYTVYHDGNPCLYGAEPHLHFKNYDIGVHFDIVTGLYYRSTNDSNLFVNIDAYLTDSMLANRLSGYAVYKNMPSVNDEFAHLVAHCIFDKHKVTERYEGRILKLLKHIDDDVVLDRKNYSGLLNRMFYKTTDSIFNAIKTNNVKNIYDAYVLYTDY